MNMPLQPSIHILARPQRADAQPMQIFLQVMMAEEGILTFRDRLETDDRTSSFMRRTVTVEPGNCLVCDSLAGIN